jgi:hypothetical protein
MSSKEEPFSSGDCVIIDVVLMLIGWFRYTGTYGIQRAQDVSGTESASCSYLIPPLKLDD